ncbi:MAG TPA: MlaD family protein [Pseudonocardia sp.]|jgi:phospholipid/cholesterol/gamma-HCH transport system substrate-binding protein|uniref:MlaD family protein n=1 Tax=Pseudonocardia sp. TaxID=60912 RepID=UPI002F40A330
MVKPESRAVSRSFIVGIGGLGLIVLLSYLTVAAQYGNPFGSMQYVKAVFHDVHALQLKDPVRQNSKGIGRVTQIDFDNGTAIVTMQIEQGGSYQVFKDASAFIGDQSAVGAKFVNISPGNPRSGPLPNDTIPITQTRDSRDLYQVLNIFDPKTRTGTQSFLRQFGGGLAGHAEGFQEFVHNAPDTLNGLGTLSAALASKQSDLPGLLNAADQLSSRFRGREAEIASLIDQTAATFDAISVDGAKPLSAILQKAPDTLTQLKTATDSLNAPLADTQAAMTSLQPGALGLGTATPDLRGVFRESVPVFGKVPDVADQATPAVKDLTPTFRDVRPLAPRVTEFLTRFATPLEVLAPYGKELGYLFVRGNSFVSEGTASGVHYARLNADVQGPYSADAGLLKACHFQTDPYPKPGQADHDRTKLGLQNSVPCGVQARGLPETLGDK